MCPLPSSAVSGQSHGNKRYNCSAPLNMARPAWRHPPAYSFPPANRLSWSRLANQEHNVSSPPTGDRNEVGQGLSSHQSTSGPSPDSVSVTKHTDLMFSNSQNAAWSHIWSALMGTTVLFFHGSVGITAWLEKQHIKKKKKKTVLCRAVEQHSTKVKKKKKSKKKIS